MSSTFSPLHISEAARQKIHEIMDQKQVPDSYGLRIVVQGKGCLGHSLGLGFDRINKNDFHFMQGNLTIIIDKKNLLYVAGQQLDYIEKENQYGFTFSPVTNRE